MYLKLAITAAFLALPASAQPAKPAADPLIDAIRASIDSALSSHADKGSFAAAEKDLTRAFDTAIAYADPATPAGRALFIDAAYALRLVSLASAAPEERRTETYRYLRENDELGRTLAFLVRDGEGRTGDDKAGVCKVLYALRAQGDKAPPKHPALAAAICVVHDRPPRDAVAHADRRAPDPAHVFAYYTAGEKKMLFSPSALPAELLVFMVDSTSPIREMNWAMGRYQGNRNVGKRFFEVTYDTRAYRQGADKKVSGVGVTLENIRKVGGVCAEQAYFATQVGKAIGVPTAFVYGQSGSDAHAWVGFLQETKDGLRWNFEEGRYEDYEDVRGRISDPQTAVRLSDSDLTIAALAASEPAADRWFAVATADAARRLRTIGKDGVRYPPALPEGAAPDAPARPNVASARLDLVEFGVRAAPGSIDSWRLVQELARSSIVPAAQRTRWFGMMNAVAGKSCPDFCIDTMGAMIEGEDDAARRREAWEWLADQFKGRAELVAQVRTAQARADEKQKDYDAALAVFRDVMMRFANDGPFIVDAAEGVRRCTKALGRKDDAAPLIKDAWQRVKRPGSAKAAVLSSNYYRLGQIYEAALRDAGRTREAAEVDRQLDSLR